MSFGKVSGQPPSNKPMGPAEAHQPSFGFSQWADAPSAYSAVGNTSFGQPVGQIGSSSRTQPWRIGHGYKQKKQVDADNASSSSFTLPSRTANTSMAACDGLPIASLPVPMEQTEGTHASPPSAVVFKKEDIEEGEISEFPRPQRSESMHRNLIFSLPQQVSSFIATLWCSQPYLMQVLDGSLLSQSWFS